MYIKRTLNLLTLQYDERRETQNILEEVDKTLSEVRAQSACHRETTWVP
jgi:hypothetical protein